MNILCVPYSKLISENKFSLFQDIEAAIHGLGIENIGKVKVFVTTIENAVGL